MAHARSATQGECSNIQPSVATNCSRERELIWSTVIGTIFQWRFRKQKDVPAYEISSRAEVVAERQGSLAAHLSLGEFRRGLTGSSVFDCPEDPLRRCGTVQSDNATSAKSA